MSWIKCSDKLPDYPGRYFVYDIQWGVSQKHFEFGQWIIHYPDDKRIYDKITHWQEIPKWPSPPESLTAIDEIMEYLEKEIWKNSCIADRYLILSEILIVAKEIKQKYQQSEQEEED